MSTEKDSFEKKSVYEMSEVEHVTARVKLLPEELRVKSKRLAEVYRQLKDVEAQSKASAAEWKVKIAELTSVVETLMEDVRMESEPRLVECHKEVNFDTSMLLTIRNDTKEVINTDSLSRAQRDSYYEKFHQEALPFEVPPDEQEMMAYDNDPESPTNVTPLWDDVAKASAKRDAAKRKKNG